MSVEIEGFPHHYKHTLCEKCDNAVPNPKEGKGCAWSMHFSPVEGWEAIPTKYKYMAKDGIRVVTAYHVVNCPEFIPDPPHKYNQLRNKCKYVVQENKNV